MQHQVADNSAILVIDELLLVRTIAHRIWMRTLDEHDIPTHVILVSEEFAVLGDGFSDQIHDIVARTGHS